MAIIHAGFGISGTEYILMVLVSILYAVNATQEKSSKMQGAINPLIGNGCTVKQTT